MPYYHTKDNGKIGFWSRRCSKCGKRWPIMVWVNYPPPSDMSKYIVERKGKKPATYAKWADKYPFVSTIAPLLPNWPRWARLLTVCLFLFVIVLLIMYVTRGF